MYYNKEYNNKLKIFTFVSTDNLFARVLAHYVFCAIFTWIDKTPKTNHAFLGTIMFLIADLFLVSEWCLNEPLEQVINNENLDIVKEYIFKLADDFYQF